MRNNVLTTGLILFALGFARPAYAQEHGELIKMPVLWGDELYTETYTMILDLNERTYMQLQFVVSNAGPGDEQGACRALVIDGDKEPWTLSKKVKRSQWSYSRAKSSILDLKNCYLSAGDKIEAEMILDGSEIRVSLGQVSPGFKPPYGDISVAKDKHYRGRILVSRADATVVFKKKGRRVRQLKGVAYLDHSIGNVLPKKIATSWLRVRSLQAQCPLLVLLQVHPSHNRAVGWYWSGEDTKANRIENVEPFWKNPKVKIKDFRLPQIKSLKGQVAGELYRFVPMREYGLLGRLVGSVVGSPVTTTYRVRLNGPESCSGVEAIMEVAFSDI